MYMVTYGLLEFDRNSELNIILDCYCSAFIFNSQDILLSRTSTFTWGYSFFICKVWVFQPLLELKKDLQTQAKMSSLSQSGIWLFFAKTFDLPSFSIPPPILFISGRQVPPCILTFVFGRVPQACCPLLCGHRGIPHLVSFQQYEYCCIQFSISGANVFLIM